MSTSVFRGDYPFLLLNLSCRLFRALSWATKLRAVKLKFVFFQLFSRSQYVTKSFTQAAVYILGAEFTFIGAMLSMFHVMLSICVGLKFFNLTHAYLI